jgi:DNA-binding NarL/FixJ family response regulator
LPTSRNPHPLDEPIVVAVVDDHPAIVASIVAAIEAAPDIRLGGTAGDFGAAVTLLELHDHGTPSIEVLLLDIQLSGQAEGLRLLGQLADRANGGTDVPAVIILSGFDQPSLIRAAFERGAAGYLVKTADMDEILAAIRVVAAGGTAFSATAVRSVRSAPRRPSDREIQVIGLISAGASNAEAAAMLDLSEKTIESHLRRMFDRYGVLSRTELAVLAMREGWVSGARPSS